MDFSHVRTVKIGGDTMSNTLMLSSRHAVLSNRNANNRVVGVVSKAWQLRVLFESTLNKVGITPLIGMMALSNRRR